MSQRKTSTTLAPLPSAMTSPSARVKSPPPTTTSTATAPRSGSGGSGHRAPTGFASSAAAAAALAATASSPVPPALAPLHHPGHVQAPTMTSWTPHQSPYRLNTGSSKPQGAGTGSGIGRATSPGSRPGSRTTSPDVRSKTPANDGGEGGKRGSVTGVSIMHEMRAASGATPGKSWRSATETPSRRGRRGSGVSPDRDGTTPRRSPGRRFSRDSPRGGIGGSSSAIPSSLPFAPGHPGALPQKAANSAVAMQSVANVAAHAASKLPAPMTLSLNAVKSRTAIGFGAQLSTGGVRKRSNSMDSHQAKPPHFADHAHGLSSTTGGVGGGGGAGGAGGGGVHPQLRAGYRGRTHVGPVPPLLNPPGKQQQQQSYASGKSLMTVGGAGQTQRRGTGISGAGVIGGLLGGIGANISPRRQRHVRVETPPKSVSPQRQVGGRGGAGGIAFDEQMYTGRETVDIPLDGCRARDYVSTITDVRVAAREAAAGYPLLQVLCESMSYKLPLPHSEIEIRVANAIDGMIAPTALTFAVTEFDPSYFAPTTTPFMTQGGVLKCSPSGRRGTTVIEYALQDLAAISPTGEIASKKAKVTLEFTAPQIGEQRRPIAEQSFSQSQGYSPQRGDAMRSPMGATRVQTYAPQQNDPNGNGGTGHKSNISMSGVVICSKSSAALSLPPPVVLSLNQNAMGAGVGPSNSGAQTQNPNLGATGGSSGGGGTAGVGSVLTPRTAAAAQQLLTLSLSEGALGSGGGGSGGGSNVITPTHHHRQSTIPTSPSASTSVSVARPLELAEFSKAHGSVGGKSAAASASPSVAVVGATGNAGRGVSVTVKRESPGKQRRSPSPSKSGDKAKNTAGGGAESGGVTTSTAAGPKAVASAALLKAPPQLPTPPGALALGLFRHPPPKAQPRHAVDVVLTGSPLLLVKHCSHAAELQLLSRCPPEIGPDEAAKLMDGVKSGLELRTAVEALIPRIDMACRAHFRIGGKENIETAQRLGKMRVTLIASALGLDADSEDGLDVAHAVRLASVRAATVELLIRVLVETGHLMKHTGQLRSALHYYHTAATVASLTRRSALQGQLAGPVPNDLSPVQIQPASASAEQPVVPGRPGARPIGAFPASPGLMTSPTVASPMASVNRGQKQNGPTGVGSGGTGHLGVHGGGGGGAGLMDAATPKSGIPASPAGSVGSFRSTGAAGNTLGALPQHTRTSGSGNGGNGNASLQSPKGGRAMLSSSARDLPTSHSPHGAGPGATVGHGATHPRQASESMLIPFIISTGDVYMLQGDVQEALDCYERARGHAEAVEHSAVSSILAECEELVALAYAMLDKNDAAAVALQRAAKIRAATQAPVARAEGQLVTAVCHTLLGRREQAVLIATQAVDAVEVVVKGVAPCPDSVILLYSVANAVLGAIHAFTGDAADAKQCFETATEEYAARMEAMRERKIDALGDVQKELAAAQKTKDTLADELTEKEKEAAAEKVALEASKTAAQSAEKSPTMQTSPKPQGPVGAARGRGGMVGGANSRGRGAGALARGATPATPALSASELACQSKHKELKDAAAKVAQLTRAERDLRGRLDEFAYTGEGDLHHTLFAWLHESISEPPKYVTLSRLFKNLTHVTSEDHQLALLMEASMATLPCTVIKDKMIAPPDDDDESSGSDSVETGLDAADDDIIPEGLNESDSGDPTIAAARRKSRKSISRNRRKSRLREQPSAALAAARPAVSTTSLDAIRWLGQNPNARELAAAEAAEIEREAQIAATAAAARRGQSFANLRVPGIGGVGGSSGTGAGFGSFQVPGGGSSTALKSTPSMRRAAGNVSGTQSVSGSAVVTREPSARMPPGKGSSTGGGKAGGDGSKRSTARQSHFGAIDAEHSDSEVPTRNPSHNPSRRGSANPPQGFADFAEAGEMLKSNNVSHHTAAGLNVAGATTSGGTSTGITPVVGTLTPPPRGSCGDAVSSNTDDAVVTLKTTWSPSEGDAGPTNPANRSGIMKATPREGSVVDGSRATPRFFDDQPTGHGGRPDSSKTNSRAPSAGLDTARMRARIWSPSGYTRRRRSTTISSGIQWSIADARAAAQSARDKITAQVVATHPFRLFILEIAAAVALAAGEPSDAVKASNDILWVCCEQGALNRNKAFDAAATLRTSGIIARACTRAGVPLRNPHANRVFEAFLDRVGSDLGHFSPHLVPLLLDGAEARCGRREHHQSLQLLAKALRIVDSHHLLYLIGPLFAPRWQLSEPEARERDRLALERTGNQVGAGGSSSRSLLPLALLLQQIGLVHEASGVSEQAVSSLQQSIATFEMFGARRHIGCLGAHLNIARCLLSAGNVPTAHLYAQWALDLFMEHHYDLGDYRAIPMAAELFLHAKRLLRSVELAECQRDGLLVTVRCANPALDDLHLLC